MTRTMRLAAVPATGLLTLALLPASAGAGVAKKDYACYGEGNIYISTLEIKTSKKYKYLGEGGKYRYRSEHKTLKFKNGPLEDWVGHYAKSDGDPAIKIVTDQAGGQTQNCYS